MLRGDVDLALYVGRRKPLYGVLKLGLVGLHGLQGVWIALEVAVVVEVFMLGKVGGVVDELLAVLFPGGKSIYVLDSDVETAEFVESVEEGVVLVESAIDILLMCFYVCMGFLVGSVVFAKQHEGLAAIVGEVVCFYKGVGGVHVFGRIFIIIDEAVVVGMGFVDGFMPFVAKRAVCGVRLLLLARSGRVVAKGRKVEVLVAQVEAVLADCSVELG